MRIDHVIYAAADLDAATARFEDELGLPVAGGGRHEGHGTCNRIVPLGGGYLEVLAVADPREAAASPFGPGPRGAPRERRRMARLGRRDARRRRRCRTGPP